MKGVLLDASRANGGVELLVATIKGLERVRVPQEYRIYLLPRRGLEASKLSRGLALEGLSSWIEEWFKPPWYDDLCKVVVVSSENPYLLEKLSWRLEAQGIARRVNQYPGMLVEALWRLNITPGVMVGVDNDAVRVLEDADDPLYPPPPLRIASLEAYSWHGEIAVPWEKPDYYIIECCGYTEKLSDPQTVLDSLEEYNPHIIIARMEARHTLPHTHKWLWFDPSRNLVSIWGLIEWMRISQLPFHHASQAPIGKILTAAEAHEAFRRKYLIDPETPRLEPFRNLIKMASADMAGAARIPEPGLYWHVYQLDYSSLYPSLIHLHNISSETVWKPGCHNYEEAPQVGHRICLEKKGLVPRVLGSLVARRSIIKKSRIRDPRIVERADAIKWILVSGFGYLGYRNSLFGSITAYESVTAYARKALVTAEEEAERAGYRLIHSIVDSIFIQPVEPTASVEELVKRIERKTGIPLKIEAIYKWLYIPPTLKGHGAVNKYYGALKGGGVKLRGIMAVRRDTPPLVARTQKASILLIARAGNPREFHEKLLVAYNLFKRVSEEILSGKIPPRLLTITKKLSYPTRKAQPYRKRLDEKGLVLDRVKYLVTSKGPRPVWEIDSTVDYDPAYYLEILERARRELPSHRGEDGLIGKKHNTIYNNSIL